MLNLTPQLQIIVEYCDQVLFAFKLFTFPEIWKDDSFCERRKQQLIWTAASKAGTETKSSLFPPPRFLLEEFNHGMHVFSV